MTAVPSSETASTHRLIPADVGLGLGPEHHALVLERRPAVAWFEVRAEPLMARGDWLRDVESIARDYPLSIHAAGLSLGSATRPEPDYLRRLGELLARLQPDFVSDHLSWSAVDSLQQPDLMPLPYTEETLASVIRNVIHVQDLLKRQILLENPRKSLRQPEAALSEEAFLAEVVLRTGCGIVLDIDNLQLRATGLRMDAHGLLECFLDALEPQSIAEIHINTRDGVADRHRDTAGRNLFASAVAAIGPIPTLVEWQSQTASFDAMQAEAATLRSSLLQSSRQVGIYADAS